MEYTWNGSIIRKATGIVCREEDWNPKGDNGRGELRPSFGKEYKHRNQQLKNRVDKIDALLADYHEQHPNQITRDVIVGFLDDKPLARKDMGKNFYEFTTELLRAEYERNRIGKSTYENGMSYMGMFTEFLLSKDLGTYKRRYKLRPPSATLSRCVRRPSIFFLNGEKNSPTVSMFLVCAMRI